MSLDSAETALALCCEAAQEPSENIKMVRTVRTGKVVKFLLIDKNTDHEKEDPLRRVQR